MVVVQSRKLIIKVVAMLIILAGICEARKGHLNQPCSSRDSCGTFGYVCGQNSTCQCDQYYYRSEIDERCLGGVNQQCRYDEHCTEGAFCELQKFCKCKENIYPSDDGLFCSSHRLGFSLWYALTIIGIVLFF